jgi:hypothetical protein
MDSIIRYQHYQEIQDPSNYHRKNVMLFVPWRYELKELIDVDIGEKFD